MKALFALVMTCILAHGDPGITVIPTPKHAYISIGHMPFLAHDADNTLFLAVFICRDKNGNRITVGVNIKEIEEICSQMHATVISYDK